VEFTQAVPRRVDPSVDDAEHPEYPSLVPGQAVRRGRDRRIGKDDAPQLYKVVPPLKAGMIVLADRYA
jgi:hypothetical protein